MRITHTELMQEARANIASVWPDCSHMEVASFRLLEVAPRSLKSDPPLDARYCASRIGPSSAEAASPV